jgi:hypothetical protein
MKKFEYSLVALPAKSTAAEIEKLLNGYGKAGWELCGMNYGSFIFKREVV